MSIRIRCLEDQLGTRLFERKHRDVRLTFAGRELLAEAQAVVDMHDRLFDRANARLLTGSVRLGIDEGCSVNLLPRLLEKVLHAYSALEFEVRCENGASLQRKVEEGALDLAVVMSFERLPSAAQLSRPRLRWVASPDFTISDWSVLPIAFHPEDSLLGAVDQRCLEFPRCCISAGALQR